MDVFWFGTVRAFYKNLKTECFLERYGSRYKILRENGNEFCSVWFALFNEKTDNGRLLVRYGLRLKHGTLYLTLKQTH